MVDAILKQYPDVDRMMAETIVMMHAQGKLDTFVNQMTELIEVQDGNTTVGTIEIQPIEIQPIEHVKTCTPEEKCESIV